MSRRLLPAIVLLSLCAGSSIAAEPLHVRVDHLLRSKPLGVTAAPCSDAEFLRRTFLNLAGTIPTSDEARLFLDDKSPDKRPKLVDRLLNRAEYLRRMTDFFDVMFTERRRAAVVNAADWRKYLYDSLAAGKPYNQLAREILAGQQAAGKPHPASRFYFDRSVEPNQLTRDVGRIFFGKDLQCAQCHNHPLVDNYFQSDYYGLYAFLNRTYQFTDRKRKLTLLAEKAEGTVGFTSVFTKTSDRTLPRLPGGPQLYDPLFPKGADTKPSAAGGPDEPKFSRRELLANQATNGSNPSFNRNIVNRLWRMMMGRGLVEPVDFRHPDNPPSHPELLDLLADEFAKSKYDVKLFLREIALTEIYQRSFALPRELTSSKLTALIPQLTAEKKRLEAVRLASEKSVTKLEAEAKPLKAAIAKVEDELAKADSAIAVLQKQSAPAAKALAAAQTQLNAGQPLLDKLNAAAGKTADVAKQLPQDKDVAAALKTFQTKAAALSKRIDALKRAVAMRQKLLKPYADKIAAGQKAAAAIIVRLNAARAKLAPVDKRLAAATVTWKADQTAANSVGKQLGFANTTVALEQAGKSLAASRELFGKLTVQLAASQKQPADLVNQLAAAKAKAQAAAANVEEVRAKLTKQLTRRFAVRPLQPLSPEQMAWSIMEATGFAEQFRRSELAAFKRKNPKSPLLTDPKRQPELDREIERAVAAKMRNNVAIFVRLFGAGAGQPQDEFFATVDQALYLSNNGQVRGWLSPSGTNLTARLLKLKDAAAVADELYLSVLTRRPTKTEIADVTNYLKPRTKDRSAALQELAWGLLTSAEFRFNH